MKWLFLIAALLAVSPLTMWLRKHPREAPKVWVLFGFLAFSFSPLHLYLALVSWPLWPGYVKGIELSVVDLLALALYFSLPKTRASLPFLLSMFFYFLTSVLSIAQTDQVTTALFYPWQLLRLFAVYVVVAKASSMDDRVASSILKGMAFALFVQTGFAIWQRFGQGIVQASGMFVHQNTLGMLSHFVSFPFFPLLLSGGSGWLPGTVTIAGSLVGVLTTSRGTVGLAAFGYALLFSTSILRGWTARKAVIAMMVAAALVILIPLAISAFDARFARDKSLENYDERAAFKLAASWILSDHPMGVGTNQFIIIANTGGYYARAGVAWTSFDVHVHNVYWLVAVETGYIGVLAFIILLIRPLGVALSCGWRNQGDKRGELLFGIGVALLTVYLQSLYEWVFISFEIEYVFAIFVGMVAGLSLQLGYWQRKRLRPSVAVGAKGEASVTVPMKGSPLDALRESHR